MNTEQQEPEFDRQLALLTQDPSLMPEALSQSISINIHPTVNRLVQQCRSAVEQCQAKHTLICAPDGYGKSHLLTLLWHQLQDEYCAQERCTIHQFKTFHWAVTNFQQWQHKLEAIQSDQTSTPPLPCIILMESIDVMLINFGKADVKSWQQWLKANPHITLIATAEHAPDLDDWQRIELPALQLSDTETLLKIIGANQTKLPEVLDSAKGRACARALQHMCQGRTRDVVAFARLMVEDPLHEFNDILLRLVDDHHAQLQSLMGSLSVQQRQLVSYLGQAAGAVSVTQLAEANHISHQTASGQLKKLRDAQIVQATNIGRTAWYELTDEMLRLTLNDPGHDIEFVRFWFDAREPGHRAEDGYGFVFDAQWLLARHTPRELPLNIRLQPTISGFLKDDIPLAVMLEKLADTGANVLRNHNDAMACEHMDLQFALICHRGAQGHIEDINGLSCALLDWVSQANQGALWRHLGTLATKLAPLLAVYGQIDALTQLITALEKQEPSLHSMSFSVDISHALVSKAKAVALKGDAAKTRQVLEQLRFRAEKRNNSAIAGAFAHAVMAVITYVATVEEKYAGKLVRQVEDVTARYPLYSLRFGCGWRLWSILPEQVRFNRMLDYLPDVSRSDGFSHELCGWLTVLAQRPSQRLTVQLQALWQALADLDLQTLFSGATIQVGISLKQRSAVLLEDWIAACQELSADHPSVTHSLKILQAMNTPGNDHQWLGLPKSQRVLLQGCFE